MASTPAAAIEPIAKSTPSAAEGAGKALERGGQKAEKPKGSTAPKKRAAGAPAFKQPSSAKRMILFSVVLAGGAVVFRDIKRGQPVGVRVGVGVVFAGIVLSALADVVPEVAGPLGLLILVGAFVLPGPNGEPSVGADLLGSVRIIGKKGSKP